MQMGYAIVAQIFGPNNEKDWAQQWKSKKYSKNGNIMNLNPPIY